MTTGSARALLRRLGQFLDQFSACFSRQPQRDAATQYIDGLFGDSERKSSILDSFRRNAPLRR